MAEVLRTLLVDGDCSVERVAEHFGCTRRRLIEDRNRPLAAVAEMLGFSAQRDGTLVQGPFRPQRHRLAR
ncbi:MAG TPA: hypothetical protein VJR30_14195 [Bradyrhizobium sp.]|nr:hypothetical protein [Bradyrhizobium sp.]